MSNPVVVFTANMNVSYEPSIFYGCYRTKMGAAKECYRRAFEEVATPEFMARAVESLQTPEALLEAANRQLDEELDGEGGMRYYIREMIIRDD